MSISKLIKKYVKAFFLFLIWFFKSILFILKTVLTLGNYLTWKLTKAKYYKQDKKIALKNVKKIIKDITPSERVRYNK